MIELLSNAEMAEADRLAIAGGTAGIELMERAGEAVADAVAACLPAASRLVVVAGPGNNGGDGFVAARLLAGRGYRVRVLLVGEAERIKGDAALAAKRWGGPLTPADPEGLAAGDPSDLVIDALFGAGLDRPVDGLPRAMIESMNAQPAPILAVDLPSGISGTSGAVMGTAVKASRTVTFFRKKPGHLLMPGRIHCGPVSVADIGIPASVLAQIGPQTSENLPTLWRESFPIPQLTGHKYDRGHAVVVSGPSWSTGAARLAARGALRAGAGLVTIASPREALAVNAATNLAVMMRPVDGPDELARFLTDARLNALAIGPGIGVGAATCELVLAGLAGERAVVLDADAITSFSGHPQRLVQAVQGRRGRATILTPHEGEFSRYFGALDTEQKSDRSLNGRACRRGQRHRRGAQGGDTVVAAPDGRAAIAANAPPLPRDRGAGDVLAGMAAGLLAQGMPASSRGGAVWLHGRLAARPAPASSPKICRRRSRRCTARCLPEGGHIHFARRTVANRSRVAIFVVSCACCMI
jgi:hydroxyethylthiazole kinase-like uncharacterized protein yjeF